MPHYKDASGNLHYLDDTAFEHLLPEGSVEVSDGGAAAIQAVLNPQPTHNDQINEQIVKLESDNPITHRTMREFILGVSQVIAASQGVTPAQLLDPKGPNYSYAFAAFADVNAKAIALRSQKT